MKEVRNLKNTLTKRVRPALLAVILLFTMGFSGYAPKAATNYEPVKNSNNQITIEKSVVATDDTERTFNVTLKITNNTDYINSSKETISDVDVTDIVDSNFSIVSGSNSSNSSVKGNTVTSKKDQLARGNTITVTYTIKAKDGISGSYSVNTSDNTSKVTYNCWKWYFGWYNDSENLNIKPVTVDVKAVPELPDPIDPIEVGLTKTAESIGNDQYKITFNMQGTIPESKPSQADIIVLVDKSGSMAWDSNGESNGYNNSRMKVTKDAVRDLADKVLADTNLNKNGSLRMAVATFSQNGNIESVSNGKHFSSSADEIKKVVGSKSNEGITANGGTNTQAGIRKVGDLLKESRTSRPGAKQYVVMFTDGLPTYYLNENGYVGGPGDASPDACFGYAQEEYNKIIGGIQDLGGIGYSSNSYPYTAKHLDKAPVGTYSDAKFYSVGFATEDKDKMVKFLKTTQNVIAADQFEAKYCAGSTSAITNIFAGITNDIKASISSIMNNPKIEDTITDEFKLPTSLGVNGKDLTVKVNDKEITDKTILNSIVKVDSNNSQKLTLDLSKVPQSVDAKKNVKVTVSFVVDATDPYYSNNGVKTNLGDAVLTYIDPANGEKITKTVKSPTVNIAPKQGSITIQKIVTGTDKADKFSVYLNRKNTGTGSLNDKSERYAMELVGNETKTMDFYLRGNITDVSKITNSTDMTRNYVTAGKFTASEIVPMDYENQSMQYSYDNIKWNALTSSTEFNIDKDHPNVYIRVTNNLVNDSYWRDRSDVSNTFNYTGK